MLQKLIILTLTTLCFLSINSHLHAQDGNPEAFGKKNEQVVPEEEVSSSQETEQSANEQDEPGSLLPQKENKTIDNRVAPQKSIGKSDSTQVNTKEKEPKSKYNILLYYFYKSKHEETENRDNLSDRDN